MEKGRFGLLGAATLCLALSGCGGGDNTDDSNNNDDDNNDDPKVVVAEGLYRGTTSDSRDLVALLLDDGTYWVLYSEAGLPTVGGGVQGTASVEGTLFSSADGKDFSLTEGARDAEISAVYKAQRRFKGTATFGGVEAFAFDAVYDADYETTPSLALVTGTHEGLAYTVDGNLPTSVTIAADGTLVGTRGSCSIAGTIAPRSRGNAYDLALSFSGPTCIVLGATVEGVALVDGTTGLVTASALNDDRTVGFIFTELSAK